jgi:hypothetical protein
MTHQNYGLRMRPKHGKPPHERKRKKIDKADLPRAAAVLVRA